MAYAIRPNILLRVRLNAALYTQVCFCVVIQITPAYPLTVTICSPYLQMNGLL